MKTPFQIFHNLNQPFVSSGIRTHWQDVHKFEMATSKDQAENDD